MSPATISPPMAPIALAPMRRRMTTEEMLSLPNNEVDRWLIDGELREKPLTIRNRFHSDVMVCVSSVLKTWRDQQPTPRGKVYCGECGVRLRKNPDLTVGVDVVYASHDLVIVQTEVTTLVEGIPSLIVEILSPNDTVEEVNEKINAYLSEKVPHIWIIDPYRQTVVVHRPKQHAFLLNPLDEITAEPELPGFRVAVARLFD